MARNYLFYVSQNYSFQILRPLQQQIRARGDSVKWFFEGNEVNPGYLRGDEQRIESIQEVIAYQPDAVFVPGNFVPNFIPGLKVQVFHGFVGSKVRKKDGVNYHFIIRGCFDLYCTHGPSSTLPFEQLAEQHGHFLVKETGWCKMDPYFDSSTRERDHQRPIILFSSTFSPRLTQAPRLLETIKNISKDSKWQWWVTFHPKMDNQVVDAYKAAQHDNLTFIETDDLTPYMEQADVMLGDYSSMLTDFLLLNKPVVTFDNNEIGHNDFLINIQDESQLEPALAQALSRPDDLMKAIAQYAEVTHPCTDGMSSARVLDMVEQLINEPPQLKPKPLNLIRNLKQRKALGYWKL